ncbi:MAG: zinc-ribbon domain-containing protein [Rhodopirellula sp.]|nr:zinc-ribbon domain-containing protein [Rhodopirellula sp.]
MTIPVLFGFGKGAKQLGEGFVHLCDNCNNANRFIVAEVSRKASVYFVPIAKWSREYVYVCPICSYGFKIPSRELAQRVLAAAFRDPTTIPDDLAARLAEAISQADGK